MEGISNPAFLTPLFTGIASIVLSFIVFFSDARSKTNQWFLLCGLSIGLWAILTAFSIILAYRYLIILHMAVFVAWLVAPSILFTFVNFPKKEDVIHLRIKIIAWSIVFVTMLFQIINPNLFIRGISGIAEKFFLYVGPLYFLSPLELFVGIGVGFFFLYKTYQKSTGRIRAQMAASMIGIIIAVIGTFLGNTFSPWLGYAQVPLWFGPLFAFIGVVSFSYVLFEVKDSEKE